MSALAAWIESLPLEISENLKCKEKKIDFDFAHIECVDEFLFLWNEHYSPKILRIHLETKSIEPIIIRQNIKIDSLKVISRNKCQFLLISENKLKSQLHLINIKNPKEQFSYASFSSNILQIEHTSISSHTVFVLTRHNFNIIGLNDECNAITYHDRIDIQGRDLVNFCVGTPKHLHDKLLNEYNFYYGLSKFAAYFIDKHGEIYVCSPIIPNRFQCTLQLLDTLRYDFDTSNDDEDEASDELYDLWLNGTWNISVNTNMNESIINTTCQPQQAQSQPYATHNAKAQFMYQNKAIDRSIYKLNIHQTQRIKSNAFCTKIMMLDLDSFFFNEERLKKQETVQSYEDYMTNVDDEPNHIFPILIRIWSDHSIDIVCCGKAIRPSFDMNCIEFERMISHDLDDYDGFVISKNYLESNDEKQNETQNNACFIVSKCLQNLDEVIVGHTLQGIYRLQMKWLKQIPIALQAESTSTYFELLQKSTSNIEQIPLYKFYKFHTNSRHAASNAILSDLCIATRVTSNDELIILDEHLKAIHAFPLYNIDMNWDGEDEEKRTQKKKKEIEIDAYLMKPYENEKEVQQMKDALERIRPVFDIGNLPNDFSLKDPSSLKWFVENVKERMEEEMFSKLELGHLLMDERKQFIENQMKDYVVPQTQLIQDRLQQMKDSNRKLNGKITEITDNHRKLEEKIKHLQHKMKQHDSVYNNDNMKQFELMRFQSILQDFEKEMNAVEYDYNALNKLKMDAAVDKQTTKKPTRWTHQDQLHLNGKIKTKMANSNRMLKEIVDGLRQM
eukprot:95929_1